MNLDTTDWSILRELQADARLSYAEIGRRVGLSSPAVQERVRRMEDNGIIEGYHAKVNVQKLNLPLMGIIRLVSVQDHATKEKILDILCQLPEVTACYQVTGEDEFIIHLHAQSIEHMSQIKMKFANLARLVTSIVIKRHIEHRIISAEAFPYLANTEDSSS
ncbi:MAG: Lrp/AsnC family transcriptional regulator [Chloroflexota bacterium]